MLFMRLLSKLGGPISARRDFFTMLFLFMPNFFVVRNVAGVSHRMPS